MGLPHFLITRLRPLIRASSWGRRSSRHWRVQERLCTYHRGSPSPSSAGLCPREWSLSRSSVSTQQPCGWKPEDLICTSERPQHLEDHLSHNKRASHAHIIVVSPGSKSKSSRKREKLSPSYGLDSISLSIPLFSWLTRLRGTEKCLKWDQSCADCQCRSPLVLQDIEADGTSLRTDVRMPDLGVEFHLPSQTWLSTSPYEKFNHLKLDILRLNHLSWILSME